MIGTTLGRYRITAALGESGTGSVWLAEDTLLARPVALKLLAPRLVASDEARERFVREARAAARLAHPGIATVHDAGEAGGHVFVAYQYVEGEPLTTRLAAGPLALPELLRVAAVTADALAHAHERGQVHGGLTSASIALRADGSPVIMDFGLARPLGGGPATTEVLTAANARALAPEQWRGEPGSAASDLWALGVVLYEAATGRFPFAGESADPVMRHVLADEPQKPSRLRTDLPTAFDQVVMALLRQDPRDRPSSAGVVATLRAVADAADTGGASIAQGSEAPMARIQRWWRKQSRRRFGPVQVAGIVVALAALTAIAAVLAPRLLKARERVLAVLPMAIAGGDSTEAAVATEALGEELVGRLRGRSDFHVLPWVTSGRPLPPDTSLVKVAEGMRASMLLTGRITSGDEDTRVHVALVDGRTGLEHWSRDLSAPAGDFATLQGQVTLSVAEGMSGHSSDALRARIAADAPRNPEAYAYFIRGAGAWHSGDPDRMHSARGFFEQALALDSTLAAAWVALGATHVDAVAYATESDTGSLVAQRCFERALRIQPGLPVAERGLISLIYEAGSGEDLCSRMLEIAGRALQRDPNDVDQLTTAVWGFTLGSQPELALPVIEHTLRLDPGNQSVSYYLVLALGGKFMPMRCIAAGADYMRRFGEDIEVLSGMGAAATYLSRNQEAITYLERAVQLVGENRWHPCKTMLMRAYAAAGDTARAEAARRRISEELHRKLAADSTLEVLKYGLYVTRGNEHEGRQQLGRLAQQNMTGPPDTTETHELDLGGGDEALAISCARVGRMDEARRILRRVSPNNEGVWLTGRPGAVVDSLGTKWDTNDPRILALWRTPEAIALHAGQEAHMVALFNRYQRVVAAALPHEPDVPKPKTKWWRRGPR